MTERMIVTDAFCDWTTAVGSYDMFFRWALEWLPGFEPVGIRSAFKHERAFEWRPYGVKVYFSPRRPEAQAVLVIDGEAWSYLRELSGTVSSFGNLYQLAKYSNHYSRLDLTVDMMDNGALAEWSVISAQAGNVSFGRRTASMMREIGNAGSATLYVGKRTSPKMLRIYNKSAQSKGKLPATRIEFELKDYASRVIHQKLLSGVGNLTAGTLFNGLLLEFLDAEEWPTLADLFYGDVATIRPHEHEAQLDKREWLKRQVAPSFITAWDGSGKELWVWFEQYIREHTDIR